LIQLPEVLANISSEQQASLMDKYAQFYCSKTPDVRKCPNPECSYAGTIAFDRCKKPLECEKCHEKWNDPLHFR
jgi:hypothetical protein